MTCLIGVGGFAVPAFPGNVIGGSALFVLLAHAEVRHETEREPATDPAQS